MAKPGIPYETVRSFIDAHVADAGALPSIAAIVAACGGSATTITRFRRRYVEETQGIVSDVPDPLAESIAAGARTLWKEMVEALAVREGALDAAFENRMQEANATVEQARNQTLTAQQEARETRAALDEARAAFVEERRAATALGDRLTGAETALAKAHGAVEALETRVAERDAAIKRCERESAERLAAAGEATARLEHQAEARIAGLEAAQAQALAEQHERVAGLQKTLEERQKALAAQRQTAAETGARLADSEGQNAALRSQVNGDAERITALEAHAQQLTSQLADARDKLEQTAGELFGAMAALEGLQAALQAARHEAEVREHDVAELRRTQAGLLGALERLGAD